MVGNFTITVEGAIDVQRSAGYIFSQPVLGVAGNGVVACADQQIILVVSVIFRAPGITHGVDEKIIVVCVANALVQRSAIDALKPLFHPQKHRFKIKK